MVLTFSYDVAAEFWSQSKARVTDFDLVEAEQVFFLWQITVDRIPHCLERLPH